MKLVVYSVAILAAGCGTDSKKPCDEKVPGNICTIAGNGTNGYAGDEGPALQAALSDPMDTLTAPDGTIYIDDWNNHRIRSLTADGKIHWVAGNGEIGGSLDDPATGDFNHPTGLLFDATQTQIYISAWHNSKVRVLDLGTGVIGDSCGDGRRAYFGDEGPALKSSLNLPSSIAWDPAGDLVIMDQANQVIRRIDAAGNIHRIAGNCIIDSLAGGGPGPCPDGTQPTACPAPSNQTTCGAPATTCGIVACNGGYDGDEADAMTMRMYQQVGQQADPGGRLAYDAHGNLYFADVSNNLIRMIDTNNVVHRIAGIAPAVGPAQGPQANGGYAGDGGPALQAQINHPIDLAFAADGTLFFSDVYNHCIRAITPDGIINTVAGQCGTHGYTGDDGPATEALLNRPYGIEWVAPSTLIVTDMGNSVVRKILLP